MQSQQKRLKWSRGETAEALEERTDTGITSASVALMENCIPDIYGNISRRPALKAIPLATDVSANSGYNVFGFSYHKDAKTIPFYITETDIILIAVYPHQAPEFLRIKDGKIVYKYLSDYGELYSGVYIGTDWVAKPISFAQQNNYLLISTESNIVKVQFSFGNDGKTFTPNIERWRFSGGWYAPNGTETKSVSSTDIVGLNFQSNSVGNYVYTEFDGSTTVYSWIKTGLTSGTITTTWSGSTTVYYVNSNYEVTDVQPATYKATFTMTNGASYSNDQVLVTWTESSGLIVFTYQVVFQIKNTSAVLAVKLKTSAPTKTYDVSNQVSISLPAIFDIIQPGSIVQLPNAGCYIRVEGYDSDGTYLRMYGSLLTPIADNNASDTIVNVEYGYVSLAAEDWGGTELYPHPKKLVFNQQRLWAGGWAFSSTEEYALVIGSQIARYNDLKNNYNQENEPITLDILTQFKEKVVHLVDYNGLKIFTDSYEYAYGGDGVQKQSGNGALETCEPLVFDSLCLYVDMTGYQIKAMQYEFQSNLFNSSSINQLTPRDLVFFPVAMASYEDKINSTGKHLFVLNKESANNPRLAVCNFVPSNQANIWSRWAFPEVFYVQDASYTFRSPYIQDVVNTKDHPIFMCVGGITNVDVLNYPWPMVVFPAVLDFDADVDMVGTLSANNRYVVATYNDGVIDNWLTIPNVPVAVYSNGEYLFEITTNGLGKITEDVSEYTNITLGSPINSVIRSHPIDVSGKTKSIKKRIGKARISCHDTPEGAITLNGKTGYMNPAQDYIEYYGVSGMKNEVKYTITNNKGAKFHIESLLMNIEYATLIS